MTGEFVIGKKEESLDCIEEMLWDLNELFAL
jgi:hypothetical protein